MRSLPDMSVQFAALAESLQPGSTTDAAGEYNRPDDGWLLGPTPDYISSPSSRAVAAELMRRPIIADVEAALEAIPPENWQSRNEWRHDLCAPLAWIAAYWPELTAECRRLMHKFSSAHGAFTAHTFQNGYDSRANDEELDRVLVETVRRLDQGRQVKTVATIFDLAREHGWTGADQDLAGVAQPPAQALATPASSAARFNAATLLRHAPPPRQWLLSTTIVRGAYALLTSDGGMGKTTLALAFAVSLATGRNLIGMHVHKRCKVVYVSGEDGREELARRLQALLRHYNIPPSDVDGWLYIVGAREVPSLRLNTTNDKGRPVVDDAGLKALDTLLGDAGADLFVLDPLMSFVPGGVNDNALASEVAGRIVDLCVRRNCAGLLLHHHSKAAGRNGETATANAAMGAAGWVNHARTVLNIVRLDKGEMIESLLLPSERHSVFRLADSKVNLAPKADDRVFKLQTVQLNNGDATLGYPNGDRVQVAVQYTPPAGGSRITQATERAIVECIARGMPDGGPFGAAPNSKARAYTGTIAEVLKLEFPQETVTDREGMAKAIVADLQLRRLLMIAEVTFPRRGGGKGGGRSGPALLAAWAATPWRDEAPPGPHIAVPA